MRNDHLGAGESGRCRTEAVPVDPAGSAAARRKLRESGAAREARVARVPGADPAAARGTARRHADSCLDTRRPSGHGDCGCRAGVRLRSGADHCLPGTMKGFRTTIVVGALALLVLFLLYPLSLDLDASLRVNGTGTITLANYAQIFASKYYVNSIANSLLTAA